mgnify:FL=1
MKMKINILTLGVLCLALVSCEKHDPFDENTITGAVGPETYWTIESSAVKAGTGMGFTAQYYSTVKEIDHSEVWYDLYEKVDKMVSCPLIKSLSYSYTSSTTEQKRVLQTIQSYKHSEDLWSDSLHAYVLTDAFPVSYTLAPVSWKYPKDTIGFTKNLNAYFGESFAKEFKDGLTPKMTYAAYMDVFKGLSRMDSAYLEWVTDSTFDKNSATWKKHFKEYETVCDTLAIHVDSVPIIKEGRGGRKDTIGWNVSYSYDIDTRVDSSQYVYPQIMDTVEKLWNNKVTFQDLILGADGYAVEYQQSFYINAEFRVYDEAGTYSSTDSKEISIN